MFFKMLPKDFKSPSGNRLIEISCLFFQKLFIFLFQSCVNFGRLKQTSGGLVKIATSNNGIHLENLPVFCNWLGIFG